MKAICEKAAKEFARMGAVVEEANPGFDNPEVHVGTIFGADALEALSAFGDVAQLVDKLSQLTSAMLFVSGDLKATDYSKVMFARQDLTVKMGKFLQIYDLLLTPVLPSPPLPVGFDDPVGFLKWVPFTFPFNLTGQPAASVPAGWTRDGLPVGLQIVGRRYDEATVFQAAAAFEEAHPWGHKKPPL